MRATGTCADGTKTKQDPSFTRLRAFSPDTLAARHDSACPFTTFWNRVMTRPSDHCPDDAALQHGLAALKAAYQAFQYPDDDDDGVEVFIIQEYNKSIERLQLVAAHTATSLRVTLLCCLAFISLETLRGNHAVAVTHLVNGLRILQSLPPSDSGDNNRDTNTTLDMPDIIQLFARLEVSAFGAHGGSSSSASSSSSIQPVVSQRE
jgi:hypothetical protein